MRAKYKLVLQNRDGSREEEWHADLPYAKRSADLYRSEEKRKWIGIYCCTEQGETLIEEFCL